MDKAQQAIRVIGALKLGVIPPKQSVEKLLASLSTEEARLSRRKYRKIKRKIIKDFKFRLDPIDNNSIRFLFDAYCYRAGLKVLEDNY